MYIIDTVPLLPIPKNQPQILSYFWPEPIKPGSLVSINIRKRKEKAVAVYFEPLAKRKILLRKGGKFQLKKLDKILSDPIISGKQIELALWLSDYYYAPLGYCLRLFVPKLSLKNLKTFSEKLNSNSIENLILIPEIVWSDYAIKNLKTENYSLLHSSLSKKESAGELKKIYEGKLNTIISTRLGLFGPYWNLKTITVYDEEDEAYFSDMTPKYNAVVVAQKMAQIHGAKITFASEYPAIPDPYQTADKYQLLKSETNPKSQIINLVDERKSGNFGIFSEYLKEKISKGIQSNKKILLFVGRRGYHNVLICKKCGSSIKCPNCEVSMVVHNLPNLQPTLICHHCEQTQEIPRLCHNCGHYQLRGIGVGIQKVESEIKKSFPEAKVLKLDSDSIKNNAEAQKIIRQFNDRTILVATQMVFPFRNQISPDIVGVIDSDTLINIPDYKAQTKLFRQLYLLKNIAQEEFITQTRSPQNNAILKALDSDFKNFNLEELENRKLFGYPPYGRLVKLTLKHPNQQRAFKEASILAEKLRQAAKRIMNYELKIIGPSPAFIPKVAKNWIFNIIIKIPSGGENGLNELKKRNELLRFILPTVQVEVDAGDLL